MTSALALLTHTAVNGGTPVRIMCDSITPSGTKNNNKKPNANGQSMPEVQTQTYENLKYLLGGVHYTGVANQLAYTDILALYTSKYNGSNAAVLNITYGDGLVLPGLSGSTDIDVILDIFSLPISAKDSKNGKLPVGSLTFSETK